MDINNLQSLGESITRLRISRNLKQSELAYEAGISERTLQRMEAGDPVKSDGLLKVLAYLGRLDDVLKAIEPPGFSPYELASASPRGKPAGVKSPRARVRTARKSNTKPGGVVRKAPALNTPGDIVWPEDQS